MKALLKAAIALGAIAATAGLLALSNYVAGVVLFMSYKQDPAGARFTTIEQAWQAAETPLQKRKVKVSILAALLVCIGGPGFLLQLLLRPKPPSPHGDARFATRLEIRKEGMDQEAGLILGTFQGRLLRLPGTEFVLLTAPTRTGKGVGFCVPNLLTFPDSAVVLDIKGENFILTGAYRQQHLGNEVFYFNPFSEHTARWNPLSYVSRDPNFRGGDLKALATIIYPPHGRDPFWPDTASNLFIGLALLVLETPALPQTLGEVVRQGSGKGRGVGDYLRHVIAVRQSSDSPLSTACVDSLSAFLEHPETTMKNILASFAAPLAIWSTNRVLDKATSADDFDLRALRRKRMTIYLHIPTNQVMQAGFILNLFFSQLIAENVRTLPEEDESLRHQCLLLMDEFTAIGKVAIIAKGVGYMAGYNLRLAIIVQDRSQLESTYGKEDAHSIVSNMGALVVFTPAQVREAEEYSKLIGNTTIRVKSRQRSNNSGTGSGSSTRGESETQLARPLLLPQELLRMDKRKALVARAGIPVIQMDKIRYFADPFFAERISAVPAREVMVQGERRQLPVSLPIPPDHWNEYTNAIERSDYYLRDDFGDLGARDDLRAEASGDGSVQNYRGSTKRRRDRPLPDPAKVSEYATRFGTRTDRYGMDR